MSAEVVIGYQDPGIHDVDSPEFRTGTVPVLKDFVKQHKATIGTTPEQRIAWLTHMQPQDLSNFLMQLNATARGITGNHIFDGEGVQAGPAGGSTPPDQEDKEQLLHYAFSEVQALSRQLTIDGASDQEVLDRAAVVLPAIVNKLHLFFNANGRTSRILRMLIRDGIAQADAYIVAIVNKELMNYDASPRPVIDREISQAILNQRGTQDITLLDDLDDDEVVAPDEPPAATPANIDSDLLTIRLDYLNFNIIARDFARIHNIGIADDGQQMQASHSAILAEASFDPDKKAEFMELYRRIRKERVVVLTDSLTGKRDIPMPPERIIGKINAVREIRSLPPLENDDVNTVAKALTASMEAKSPIRI